MHKDDLKNVSTGSSNTLLPAGWLSLDNIPPDELVQVIDAEGNTAHAYPTWYPFKVVPNHNKVGKWTSDVVPCEPYWDGCWMIACEGLTSNVGTVIGWRSVQPACRKHFAALLWPPKKNLIINRDVSGGYCKTAVSRWPFSQSK